MSMMNGFIKASQKQSPIAFCVVFVCSCATIAGVLLLGGCASTKSETSSPETISRSKQDAALRDPFNYGPKINDALSTDSKFKSVDDSDNLKRDLQRVFNP